MLTARSVRSKSTKGKSLMFMLLILAGYVFGIIHKVLYGFNWVIWAYVALMLLVMVDLALYWRNWRRERIAASRPPSSRRSPRNAVFNAEAQRCRD